MANWTTDTLIFGLTARSDEDGRFQGVAYIRADDGEPTEIKNAQKGIERVEDSISLSLDEALALAKLDDECVDGSISLEMRLDNHHEDSRIDSYNAAWTWTELRRAHASTPLPSYPNKSTSSPSPKFGTRSRQIWRAITCSILPNICLNPGF